MNIFRLAADMTHLMSIVVLLLKIHTIKSCADMMEHSFKQSYLNTALTSQLNWNLTTQQYMYQQQQERWADYRPQWTFEFDLQLEMTMILLCIFWIVTALCLLGGTDVGSGISLKTQELYALVFATRYLDLFTVFLSLYNTVMKLIFLGSSFSIVWYMRNHKVVRQTYDKDHDTFRHYLLVIPCFFLALLVNYKLTVREVLWAFSVYLEAVAILPQLVLLQRTRNVDNLTGNYVFLLGAYRGLYLVNWVYRYLMEEHYLRWISWIAGIVQTALYLDFFYYYLKSWRNSEKLQLPA